MARDLQVVTAPRRDRLQPPRTATAIAEDALALARMARRLPPTDSLAYWLPERSPRAARTLAGSFRLVTPLSAE